MAGKNRWIYITRMLLLFFAFAVYCPCAYAYETADDVLWETESDAAYIIEAEEPEEIPDTDFYDTDEGHVPEEETADVEQELSFETEEEESNSAASGEGEMAVLEPETVTADELWVTAEDGTDPAELFARYAETILYEGIVSSPSVRGDSLTASEQAAFASAPENDLESRLYEILSEKIQLVAAGELRYTVFTMSLDDLGISVREGSEEEIRSVYDEIRAAETQVIKLLIYNYPFHLYWFDKRKGARWKGPVITTSDGVSYLSGDLSVSMSVSGDYRSENNVDCYVNARGAISAQRARDNAVRIVEQCSETGAEERIRYYCDWICGQVHFYRWGDYDIYATPYGDPWQIIGVFDDRKEHQVTCEGYSKALQYLCDLSDCSDEVTCISVTGSMYSEISTDLYNVDHMWNIVHMDNGQNYLVDLTTSDYFSDRTDELILAGAERLPAGDENIVTYGVYEGDYYFKYTYSDETLSVFDASELTLSHLSYPGEDISCAKDVQVKFAPQTYSGSPCRPDPEIYVSGRKLVRRKDYTVTFSDNVNAGTAKAFIKGIGIYEGKITRQFQIKPRSVTDAAISGIVKKVCSEKAQSQTPLVRVDGETLKPDTDYELAYKNNVNTGRATIAIKGKGNYKGVAVRYFAIVPKPSWIASLSSPKTKQIKITWGKRPQISGYQIEISTNKDFKKPKMQKNVWDPAKLTMTVPVQKAKTKYYVRIRSFKKTSYKTYFSDWSAVKTVVTK